MNLKKLASSLVLALLAISVIISCKKDDPIEEEPVEVTFETVNAFLITDQGGKFIATEVGIFSFNETTEKFDFLTGEFEQVSVNDLEFSKTSPKELWIASDIGALNFTTEEYYTSLTSGLHNDQVNLLNFDYNNNSYFVTPNGISIYDNNDWIESLGSDDLYTNFEITDIASAVNGFTYVTTKGGGVERFEMDVDGISGATVFDTDWSKLESNNVNTVFIDSITQVYGTDQGVAMHYSEFTKWDWEILTTADGLIADKVISVLKDNDDNWWFGTPQGLSKYDNSSWTSFTAETDNLLSNNIKFLAMDTDGTVWVASDEGLSHYVGGQWINHPK